MRNVIIGVVVVVIVGAGGFLVFTKNQDGSRTIESSSVSGENNSSSSSDKTTSGSIDSLSNTGVAKKCTSTFGDINGAGAGEGVLFTDGNGNARMTTTTHAKGETHSINMLVKGDQVYSWTGGLGLMTTKKTSQSAPKTGSSDTRSTSPQGGSTAQNFEFKCDSWTVDPSVFTVPSNVDFKTPQTMDYF